VCLEKEDMKFKLKRGDGVENEGLSLMGGGSPNMA